ncbi:aldo/keto reductase [Luteimonas vadosa]|uniref:Aldo/keto reductase n=1 Tax=Luteimonas vadosa TaxID=1165507 RepID=A0ABP9E859_9GAMM
MVDRRAFLASAALGAGALALAPLAACRPDTKSRNDARAHSEPASVAPGASGGLLVRAIPSTGERIPVIGVGTSGSYEVPIGSPEFDRLGDVLRIFFEGGGRVIDTSPNYSNAEEVVGTLLARGGWREHCFLATKLAADDRPALEAQWAESLRRLRTDHVELLQVHNLRNIGQALPYARELQAAGKTRYVGLTHYLERGHAELERLMRAEKPDFIQVNYSVTAPQAARSLFPAAQELGVAVMVNRAFDDGRIFAEARDKPLPAWADGLGIASWAQMFLRFVLSHPAVTAVIPATGKPGHQADNLRGGIGPLLEQAQQEELIAMFG